MYKQEEKKPVILLVDDQPLNIQALAKLLRETYRILAANNGIKALEIASSDHPPDLILLDINMPAMDGYEVCRRLKSDQQTQRIPVIFVTARNEAEDEEKGFLIGASDYIVKPFQPAVVRARIRNQINLKNHTDMLEKLAMIDGLTGVPNRRFYEETIDQFSKQNLHKKQPLSILMIDIDHFKAYNDNYGHGAGDDCLRQVAQALKSSFSRQTDIIARYGGEEFSAVLPDTDAHGALYIANKMLELVRALNIPHEFSSTAPFITVSIGCAAVRVSDEETPEQLMIRADKALYLAKTSGRNQVKIDILP